MMRTGRAGVLFFLSAAVVAAGLLGCGGDESEPEECVVDTSYDPHIDPASFAGAMDNPLFPLVPGTEFTYQGATETIVVTVTSSTKVILGVTCIEVHDVASEAGEVIEDTLDWYATDSSGNVWYFGEDTKELEGGEVVSTEGSWEGGVNGAKPGLIIPANPMVNQEYRQEYYACQAEDMGSVLALDASAMVPAGSYTGCLKTHDYTPLEPELNEEKYYCPGTGLVLIVDVNTGGREELASVTP